MWAFKLFSDHLKWKCMIKSGVYEQVIYLHCMRGCRRHWGYRKPQIFWALVDKVEKEVCGKKPQPSECSGKDLDLYQTEICSFVCFEMKLLEQFLLGFSQKVYFYWNWGLELKKELNLTATVLIDFISCLMLFSLLVLISLLLLPSCQSWDWAF